MRTLIALLLVAALAGCGGKADTPTTPPFTTPTVLAADQLVFNSTRASANREIWVMKSDGTELKRLTNAPAYEHWWPRISPDRKKILFYRRPAGVADDDYTQASLWVMDADGDNVTQLIAQGAYGWALQGHAEWKPGTTNTNIAMFGSVGNPVTALEIFITDADGKNPVQYTNRGGINTDVSWSTDGLRLLFNGCPERVACTITDTANFDIFWMSTYAFEAAHAITTDSIENSTNKRADYDPYLSPDGTKLAWLINVDPTANSGLGRWSIGMVDVGRGFALSNPRFLINDGNINSKPSWSLDSSTIYFHRMAFGPNEEAVFGVFKIKADGTQTTPTRLTATGTGINEYPSN